MWILRRLSRGLRIGEIWSRRVVLTAEGTSIHGSGKKITTKKPPTWCLMRTRRDGRMRRRSTMNPSWHGLGGESPACKANRGRHVVGGLRNPMMETGSNDDSALEPALVHSGLTMQHAHSLLNDTMVEEWSAPPPFRCSSKQRGAMVQPLP